jgi:hypothetical protein
MQTGAGKSLFGAPRHQMVCALRFFSRVTLGWDRIPELIVYTRESLTLVTALDSTVKTLII